MATARAGVKTAVANRYTPKEMKARTKTEEDRRATPQNIYEGHTKLAQTIPKLQKTAKNSIIKLSGEIEMVRFTAANVRGVDLSLELSKHSKKKATTTSTPREAPMKLFVQVLRRCHGKLDRIKDRNVLGTSPSHNRKE